MTPSWYDLLDVDRDASSDEIRAAWRERVADLDPTDRRFAVLNRAAKVLLDPASRAAYDEELAAQDELEHDEDDDEDDESAAPAAVGAPEDEEPVADEPVADEPVADEPVADESEAEESETGEDDRDDEEPDQEDPDDDPAPGRLARLRAGLRPRPEGSSPLVAVMVGVLALAFAVVAVLAVVESRDEDVLADDVSAARAAAEQAAIPVLSYDSADLEAGRSAAVRYLTDDFREEYEELFDGLIDDNATSTRISVRAVFVSSGVVRTDLTADRVQVLIFFDHLISQDGSLVGQPNRNQVAMAMQRVGDEWLVDDLDIGAAGG